MKNFIKTALAAFLTFLSIMFVSANTVEAKELTQVVSDIIIWNSYNDQEPKNANGVYTLTTNSDYQLQIGFDLSNYGNKVADGDYFVLDIPSPIEVKNETIALLDSDTGIEIGEIVVEKAGATPGGKAKITLKNLEEYKDVKKRTDIINIKGTFFVTMRVQELLKEEKVTFNNIKEGGTLDVIISSRNPFPREDNSAAVAKENLAKYSGFLNEKNGQFVHSWRARVNASQKPYTSLVMHDQIDENGAPMKFIPESLVVTRGDGLTQSWSLTNLEVLKEGEGYTIVYNDNLTAFDITFTDPTKPHYINYDTTAPGDGSTVINTATLTSNEGVVKIVDDKEETVRRTSRLSKITSGGNIIIETGNRITIYKTDEETGERLGGAIFKITKPDGSEIMLKPTDSDTGLVQSPVFTEAEMAAGEFTITEVTAPDGYIITSDPIKVSVSDKGAIRTITNKKKEPKAVTLSIEATKSLTGRPLNAGEFEFDLKDETGTVVATATNDATGKIVFSDLTLTKEGTYQYTIEEKAGNLGGVTYDKTSKSVTVEVTKVPNEAGDDANFDGKLMANITSEKPTFTNVYNPLETKVVIKASKSLVGRSLKDEEFTFELKDQNGQVVSTAKNLADGTITFNELTFTETGVFNYTVSEVAGAAEGVTYDNTIYQVTITITDDGKGNLVAVVDSVENLPFENTFETTTTTTTEESTTTTTTTEEPTTTTSTTQEPTTTTSTTTQEPTTTTSTTTQEPTTTTSTTTTQEPTTTTSTTTQEPTTTTSTTTQEPTTTTSTTTQEPTTTTSTTNKKPKLPKTGETNNSWLIIFGIVIISLSGIFIYRKQKNKN
ncbi:Spy0128 family protein [Streptococcus pacificus]|uniref:LPXTG cell wall anchor domain-containing protein n=1 Tax=Streptococcus pacificus TaxID=2740577 RepID=A0ABS0ZKC9_9STRE|nr:FctA domain-containing protein [Streptococcus pacificus]MBJ8326453.1 LPXTG cell wall anchor domain-containing protein [Streptococcus pacificus]